MSVVHLCKVYCLHALMYCCESWHLQNKQQNRISVAWNNCFRSIFNCCWRKSVKPLQYFCMVLPLNYLIHERKLLFWNKLFTSDNSVFYFLFTSGISKICCNCMSVWFVVDSRQSANKAGCLGHIFKHSSVMSCVISFVLFYLFLFFCVFLVDAIVCVYVCIQLYCSCCHYGVIKHDDDDD